MFIEKIEIETTIEMLKTMPHLKGKYISSAKGWYYLPKPKELFMWMKKQLKAKSIR
jgi:hypothetical protein